MGIRQNELKINDQDEVTEASIESFPASDPPAFNFVGPRTRSRRKEAPGDTEPPRPAENTAELRGRIPSARTIGISTAAEPSAAPFDTDDEAAGTRQSAAAMRAAEEHEAVLRGSAARAGERRAFSAAGLLMAIVALAALVGVVALVWILFI